MSNFNIIPYKVVCINAKGSTGILVEGKTYTVIGTHTYAAIIGTHTYADKTYLYLEATMAGWGAERFKRIEDK